LLIFYIAKAERFQQIFENLLLILESRMPPKAASKEAKGAKKAASKAKAAEYI